MNKAERKMRKREDNLGWETRKKEKNLLATLVWETFKFIVSTGIFSSI